MNGLKELFQDTTSVSKSKHMASPIEKAVEVESKTEIGGEWIDRNFVWNCITWTNPARSLLAFGFGLLTLLTWAYVESGAIRCSPLTTLAYSGMFMLAFNFLGKIIFPNFTPKTITTEKQLRSAFKIFESTCIALVPAVNKMLRGDDSKVTLQVAGSLWLLISLGKYMNLSTICLTCFCSAFIFPPLYSIFQESFRGNTHLLFLFMSKMWNGIGMDRRIKLALVGLCLSTLWMYCAAHTKIALLFVASIAFKCFLNPEELYKIAEVAAPVTKSVRRKAERISMSASEIMKHLRSPQKNA